MKVLICGTGKSGTTAIAFALKKAFEKDYEIVFEPKTLAALDYQKSNFICKSLSLAQHNMWKKEQSYILNFEKRIVIVRHPFDVIVSFLLYDPFNRPQFNSDENVETYIDIIKKKSEHPDLVSLKKIVKTYQEIVGFDVIATIKTWYQSLFNISQNKSLDFFVLKYEDFVESKLSSIKCYLELENLTNKVDIDSKFSRVSRSKKYGDWKNYFTPKDIDEIEP